MTRVQGRGAAAVKLRRGRPGDLDALIALERKIFRSRHFADHLLSRASFRRFLAAPHATVIVADIDGQISGYVLVLYRSNSRLARMYSIGVAVHARRRGLARSLLAAAEKDAIGRGRAAMRLEARADDHGAIALYTTSSYHCFGRSPGYYGRIDGLRLEKALAKEPHRRS